MLPEKVSTLPGDPIVPACRNIFLRDRAQSTVLRASISVSDSRNGFEATKCEEKSWRNFRTYPLDPARLAKLSAVGNQQNKSRKLGMGMRELTNSSASRSNRLSNRSPAFKGSSVANGVEIKTRETWNKDWRRSRN